MQPEGAPLKLGNYRVMRELGRGGMGIVYEALDERLERTVALKVLAPELSHDAAFRARFLREARVAAAINHPNIVTVHELGETDGKLYIAMALIQGQSLRARLQSGALPAGEALRLGEQIASALAAAHAAGVVHRDLKPENVILTAGAEVRLLDFGIAKALAPTPVAVNVEARTEAQAATLAGQVLGTPGYMAPEQALGDDIDARVDVFAFGAVLYEMLAGVPAFGGRPSERMAAVLSNDPPALSALSGVAPELRQLLTRCLTRSPDERFSDGRALHAALLALRGTNGGAAVTLSTAAHPAVGSRRMATRMLLLVAGLVVLGAVVGLGLHRQEAAVAPRSAAAAAATPPQPEDHSPTPAPSEVNVKTKGPLVFPCEKKEADADAGFAGMHAPTYVGYACQVPDYVAWCGSDWKQVACCAPGLVPADSEGSCVCPPEGATDERAVKSGCARRQTPIPDKASIKAVVRSSFPALGKCYELALDGGSMAGRVAFALRITPYGDVFSVRIQDSSLPSLEAQRCMTDIWRGLKFAPGNSDGTTVIYPIEFSP